VFHAVAIALLLTMRFAPALVQASSRHVVLIAPPRELPAPPRIHKTPPRVFHPVAPAVPKAEAKIVPQEILEMPRIAPAQIDPAPAPIIDSLVVARVAPAPVQERARPASTGWFDSTQAAAVAPVRAASRTSGFSDVAASIDTVKRPIAAASFGDSTVAAPANVPRHATTEALTAPIEIQFKPRPVYSDEARRLRIEGEVQIEAVFEASGVLQIVRVVRGLGHGLDEAAIAAARGIRFRAAERGGRPVDSTAMVRIAFELAY
jgi:TonB family protein